MLQSNPFLAPTVVSTIPETFTSAPNASGKNALLKEKITTRFASARAKTSVDAGCAQLLSVNNPNSIPASASPNATVMKSCRLKYVVIVVSIARSDSALSPSKITVTSGCTRVSRLKFLKSIVFHPFIFLDGCL